MSKLGKTKNNTLYFIKKLCMNDYFIKQQKQSSKT